MKNKRPNERCINYLKTFEGKEKTFRA